MQVPRVPLPGEIIEGEPWWEEAAGGGAVAAVQLAKLAGSSTFFTALGDDDRAQLAKAQLQSQGVEMHEAARNGPQRRAVALLDPQGERTITVMGGRLVPSVHDDLPWDRLAEIDGVYFTGGDVGALRAARAAGALVATARAREALAGSDVMLDALVRSSADLGEDGPERLGWSARTIVNTRASDGGDYVGSDGQTGSFEAAPLPGPIVDAYGAGDSFAAGLTFGLGSGMTVEAALAVAARCGAGVLSGRGPYAGQPTAADIAPSPYLI